ncbi:MAG TPA: hypothetical protein VMW31_04090, partial [Devosiaceae bacterium]|nr:hypothetical protein [Devosiaceae bacterium]
MIDLSSRRHAPKSLKFLSHPAGVTLPFDDPSHPEIIVPEVRSAIGAGSYSANLISNLPDLLQSGDRVLVIGAGLGVGSSLIAKSQRAERVIAVEANKNLIPYLKRVHALNGVPWVETVNAILGESFKARVPFFARHDLRDSSLMPDDGAWKQLMMIPCMDLNLILIEEEISAIVCDIPNASTQLLALGGFGSVERILVSPGGNLSPCEADADLAAVLAAEGFVAEARDTATLFSRVVSKRPK